MDEYIVICYGEVQSRKNMVKALRSIEKNKDASGIDSLTVENLKPYLSQNWLSIHEQLLKRDYKPKPVLRVEIPKLNGEKRLLGILIVIDRLIQQVFLQILSEIFDPRLSPLSFGFSPKSKGAWCSNKSKTILSIPGVTFDREVIDGMFTISILLNLLCFRNLLVHDK